MLSPSLALDRLARPDLIAFEIKTEDFLFKLSSLSKALLTLAPLIHLILQSV